jgi:hypothetical protein
MEARKINPEDSSIRRWRDGPNWRWMQAVEIQNAGTEPSAATDWLVGNVVNYLRKHSGDWHSPIEQADETAIQEALGIQNHWMFSKTLPLLVLGDASPAAMSKVIGVDIHWVWTWRELFFDISTTSTSESWINEYVIKPEVLAARLKYAEALKQAWRIGSQRRHRGD